MNINFMSDLHLEFDHKSDDFWNALKSGTYPYGDVLILAGDITIKNRTRWIDLIAMNFKQVIYVFGNHEYYGSNLNSVERKTRESLAHLDNVHILQNESVILDGITFHGSTLWTDYNKGDPSTYWEANQMMTDYKQIRCDNGVTRFSPQRGHREHNIAKAYFSENVKEGDVVVSHHAPSYLSIHPRYKEANGKINGCYASDLSDLMLDNKPALWFHGHVHDSFDYQIGDTRVLCNPRGYAGVELNPVFDIEKYVEIGE